MEPERKIEKLLRAYAKKRRADAGEPLSLHPADRRRLQAEVARSSPKAAGGGGFSALLVLFRWRLVFALCVVGLLAVGTALLLPALSSAKKKAQNQMASADTANRRSPAPAPVPMPAAPAVAPPASMASVSQPLEKSEAAATTGESNNQNFDKVDFKLAELKSPSPGPAGGGMGGSGGLAANAPMQTQEFRQAAARLGGVYGNGAASAGTASQRFVQTGLTFARQDRFLQAEARGQTPSVLASFQVRQQGEVLSVVDQDGSVYHGSLSVNEAPFPTGQPAAEVPAAKLGAPPVQTAPGRLAGNSPPSNQNYSFRVAGTNQTLQQAVVFTGNLVTVSNAPASPAQALWSNSRIVGTVVVANTNAVEINAVPVAP